MNASTLLLKCCKCDQIIFACINEPSVTKGCATDISEMLGLGLTIQVIDATANLNREMFGCRCRKEECKA